MRTNTTMFGLAGVFICMTAAMDATGQVAWSESFDSTNTAPERTIQEPSRGGVLLIDWSRGSGQATAQPMVRLPLPVEKLAGYSVFFSADVRMENVSDRTRQWNGVKLMMVIQSPSGTDYPQAEIPTGTSDWKRYSARVDVPDNATNLFLVLGLEGVSGKAWFDNPSVALRPRFRSAQKVQASTPAFRGHSLARLRGAMAGTSLSEEDVRFFATKWKGNLLRLQIFEAATRDRDLSAYDEWLEERLRNIDRVLGWCAKYRVMAVVDLHSPPGGQAFSAGYITARGRIFTDPKSQAKFVEVWERIAARYKGNSIIWGFDLVNEPDDTMQTEDCLDWNSLADKTARAIRAIDPERTLIVEPNHWGGPQGFAGFQPLDLPGIVYSFHFYQPMKFTHQGIHGNPGGVEYPGVVAGQMWDAAALEVAMQPAIRFAKQHRVHMYAGEFSAIRTAPPGSAARYLQDVTSIFEKHGWDWSYHAYREWHGWSLEHEGPLNQPEKAASPTDRQQVITGWFARNERP